MWSSRSDRRGRWALAAVAFELALTLGPAPVLSAFAQQADAPAAQPNTDSGFVVEGAASQAPLRLDAAALRRLPGIEQRVSFMTDKGERSAVFQGAPLWAVLAEAHAVDPAKPRNDVAKMVLVTGRDGYTAALAVGEVAPPDFEGKPVLVAYAADGHPLAAPRLVVPGDKHGGRSVRDVVRITVR